jgi:hypothetical protein
LSVKTATKLVVINFSPTATISLRETSTRAIYDFFTGETAEFSTYTFDLAPERRSSSSKIGHCPLPTFRGSGQSIKYFPFASPLAQQPHLASHFP